MLGESPPRVLLAFGSSLAASIHSPLAELILVLASSQGQPSRLLLHDRNLINILLQSRTNARTTFLESNAFGPLTFSPSDLILLLQGRRTHNPSAGQWGEACLPHWWISPSQARVNSIVRPYNLLCHQHSAVKTHTHAHHICSLPWRKQLRLIDTTSQYWINKYVYSDCILI